jgi:serine/threonine protein kinase
VRSRASPHLTLGSVWLVSLRSGRSTKRTSLGLLCWNAGDWTKNYALFCIYVILLMGISIPIFSLFLFKLGCIMTLEGQQIGRYRLVRLLGSGGMGDVYLAEDARIEQQVAIKVIRAELSPYSEGRADEQAARLFRREARAISKLDHPNILPLFDFGEEQVGDTTIMYLVMPFRQEGSLASWVRHHENGTLLSPHKVAHFLQQAAVALQHAHSREVIHQDVKPSNFLLRYREDSQDLPDLLLADFGIARFMTATSSASQSIRGTPSYMAPEQWEGEAVYGTDQYALAVMAYELLTGRLPFQGGPGKMMYQHINVKPQPPSSLNAHLSKDIDSVILHALAKQPEQRFASITGFANAFQQATQGIQSGQVMSPATNLETLERTVLPIVISGVDLFAPTKPRSNTQPMGSDSETYVKPVDTPIPLTFTPPTPFHKIAALVENGTPVATTGARLRTTKHRPWLMVTFILLALALVGGGIVYALPMFLRNGSGKNITGATPSGNTPGTNTTANATVSGTSPGGIGTATSAIVTITPATRNLSNTFSITATPNPSQQQAGTRLLSTTTQSQAQTVNATGTQTTSGTQAYGILTFYNSTNPPVTFNVGTIFPNDQTPNIQMMLDQTVTVPGPNRNNDGIATASAHVVQVGSLGNVPADMLGLKNQGFYHLINNTMQIFNNSDFTGGQDPQTYTVVQQSDINGSANLLENANAPNPQQLIQPLVQPNELLIGTPQCKPNITSDHNAGDKASSVTVTLSFTCTGNVYDQNGAQSLAVQLLENQAKTDPGNGYALKGNVSTNIISATLTNASQGTVSVQVSATGTWVYQFSAALQQQLAQLIAGKSEQAAQTLLGGEPGVSNATIQLQGSDSSILPTDPGKISITIQ